MRKGSRGGRPPGFDVERSKTSYHRELSIARKAIGWCQRQGGIDGDPPIGIERRPTPPDRTKALAEKQIAAL
ncbi:hypothetical protein [Streptomyces sp. NPDC059819]|uniref:hypothetical protein n=1 Tax=Streptomyces sp. NPDC059819 TaxID=3346963 RepID=UPI0036683471